MGSEGAIPFLQGDYQKILLQSDHSPLSTSLYDIFIEAYKVAHKEKTLYSSTIWGLPLCRLIYPGYECDINSVSRVVVVNLYSKEGEGKKVSVDELFAVLSVLVRNNKTLFNGKENHTLYVNEEICEATASTLQSIIKDESVKISVLDITLNQNSTKYFLADVLLALTSPSFIEAAFTNKCKTSFDWKMHLLRRRINELPNLSETAQQFQCDDLDKMRCGEPYDCTKPQLSAARRRAQRASLMFRESVLSEDPHKIKSTSAQLLCSSYCCTIDPPIHADYGFNIYCRNAYVNVGCTFLDCGLILIGEHTMFGPNVDVYTVTHPIDANERKTLVECTAPVVIGNNSWIGGHSTLVAGVRVGNNVVIGAGSVVTKDIEDNLMVAGNPAQLIRRI